MDLVRRGFEGWQSINESLVFFSFDFAWFPLGVPAGYKYHSSWTDDHDEDINKTALWWRTSTLPLENSTNNESMHFETFN